MSDRKTAAVKMPAAMPVHTVVARVVDGADRGATWNGERGSIGSAKDNDLVLSDPTVSGYHLRVKAEKGGIRVSDFGSTNGTFLGEARMDAGLVPPGPRCGSERL